MRLSFLLLIGLLGFGVIPTSHAAPLPKAGGGDKTAEKVEAIKKALDKVGNFEFSGNTLAAVINTLSEDYKINITIDQAAMNFIGIALTEMNVEFKQRDVKLRTALRGMLQQCGLSFGIIDGGVLISTEEMIVYRQLKQRVDITVENSPLNKVLKELSQRYAINIVFDPKLKAKIEANVSLQVEDVQLDSAIKILCEMAEVKSARIGNMLYITTEARADKLHEPFNPSSIPSGPFNPGPGFPLPIGPGGGIDGVPGVVPAPRNEKPAVDPPPAPPAVAPALPAVAPAPPVVAPDR